MLDIWAGTENSLKTYMDLSEIYLHKEAYSDTEDDGKKSHLIEHLGNGVAALNINGALVPRKAWWHKYEAGNVTSYEEIAKAVSQLKEDKSVNKIVMSVTSGGGSASGVNDASDQIKSLGETKGLIAYVNSAALSAGYWLASAAPKIYANKMAEVGSIGVLAILEDYSEAAAKAGIKFHVLKAGKYKGIGFGGAKITDEDKQYLQERINKTNNFFLSHVAENRGISISDKAEWGEAKVFYAGEAKAVGLVDEVASIVDVMGGIVPAGNKTREGNQMTYEEKLAQIAAGVSPETILTAEELALYSQQASDEPGTEPELEEGGEGAEEDGGEIEGTIEDTSSNLISMAMQLGELKAELKAVNAKLQASEQLQEKLKADADSLKVVAQSAVTKLQVALSQPKIEKESAADIVAQYEDLQAKLSAKFPNKRLSSTEPDTKEVKARIPDPLRPFGGV